MTAIWPSDLPPPTRTSFQQQPQEARLRRAAETGPPAYRRRFSAVTTNQSQMIDVTRSEKETFDTFYRDVTRSGALPFLMPDYTRDGWPLLAEDGTQLLTEPGAGVTLAAQQLVLFGAETPVQSHRGLRYQISFSITVLP
ncbi:MAG: hypothetical protein AAFY65_13060 [Pseudomonadota bacterium]